jgi:hypothetical protein
MLAIGAVDTPAAHVFHKVKSVFRQRDGTLVVANAGSSELRLFDPKGALLSSSGRFGGGPGEFSTLISASR